MTEPIIVCIQKGYAKTSTTVEALAETDDLAIGNVFLIVARHYGKTPLNYPRWPSFELNRGEYEVLKGEVLKCSNDLEKIHFVCSWLGEEKIQ